MSDPLNVEPLRDYVWCFRCGAQVSNRTGVEMVVRAWVECPECLEKRSYKPSCKDDPEYEEVECDSISCTSGKRLPSFGRCPICNGYGKHLRRKLPSPLSTVEGEQDV